MPFVGAKDAGQPGCCGEGSKARRLGEAAHRRRRREEDDEDWQPRRKACRNSAVQPGAVVSGGKATKTGTVLARAQLQPAHGGVVAAQERRTALLAKGIFREAELLAQEAPVGSLATKDMPRNKGRQVTNDVFRARFGEWLRSSLGTKVRHAAASPVAALQ